ncbi:hypothetical protein KAR28_06220 [Candidatus Parcubacteria bacterium]|nr:hypothetical protein [Candidatus Parcubacteria bacterium]
MFNKIQRLLFTLFFIVGGGLMVYGTVGAVTYIMVPQGGTGAGTYASQTVLIGSSTNPIATTTWSVPQDDGTANQILKTDGSGSVTWQADDSGGGGDFATTTADYWLTTKDTADLTEGTSLYFTNGRVADYINGSSTMAVADWNITTGRVDQSLLIGSSPTFLTPTISGLVWDGVTLATSSDILNLWNIYESGGDVGIGTATPAYDLDVYGNIRADGDVRTTGSFYGDTWESISGNSMAIQPTGDSDDFFSFKTPSDRPTIKREGGKYIYFESSNVYDVGISFRKDADHSGTVNYYKDENLFGLSSKDPLVFKVCADYDDYVKICAANNIPELSVASSSGFMINAGGTNSLLLNHDGGNVGIGTSSPGYLLDVYGSGFFNDNLTVKATTTFNSVAYRFPASDGSNGQFLRTNSAGQLTWATPSGSGDMLKATYDADTDDMVDTAEDLTCTNCVNATEIEDIYLLNSGDLATGSSTFLSDLTVTGNLMVSGTGHDNFSDFVANEHLDWTADLGVTNIHAGNYTDTNTTYLGGTNLTLDGTTFNVDDAFLLNTTDTMVGQLTVNGSDSATSTIQGNIKFENNAASHGCYFIYGATTTLECF